ncbi:unnamed protein product [Cyprideis torosa]|uniref:Uncharacterized protein n=1 Tax=Cyprideis torosa TaxID=163714 RepID=A0A7R9A0E5_9CRUS|nr:unnamed protein product [Cyprideis torosa]CAG0910912.1 unnamed protein product [Cyprideis torosa]
MPPKGGDATLSEEDIRNAVIYMLKDAGQDVADDAAPTAAAEAPAEAPVAEAPAAAESTDAANTVVEKATTAVADVAESATDQAEKLVDSAGQAVDAAAGSAAAAVSGMMAAVTGAAAEPAEKAVAAVADAAPAAAEQDFTQGKAMYKQACFSCHDNGVANAPKLGDIEAWAPRIAAGNDAMYHSAIAGKGAMPPKGGRIDVSDEVIRNTVDYMVSLSGG